MSDYRSAYLRRQRAKERKEAASAERREANRLRRQMKLLSTGIALIGLALLVVIPIRFHAIAGDNMEIEQKYLMSNASEEIVSAKSLMDARLATNDKGDVGQFAESILTTDDIDLIWTRETINTTNILIDADASEPRGITTLATYDAADASTAKAVIIDEHTDNLRLYEPVGESLYYVALLDPARVEGYGKVIDIQMSYGNEPVQDGDGILYDGDTGVLYIPKDQGDKNPLAIRTLVTCDRQAWTEAIARQDGGTPTDSMTVARIESATTSGASTPDAAQISIASVLSDYHFILGRPDINNKSREQWDVLWIYTLFNEVNGGMVRASDTTHVAKSFDMLKSWGISTLKVERWGGPHEVAIEDATVRAAVENGLLPVAYDAKGKAKVLSTVKDVYDAGWCFLYDRFFPEVEGESIHASPGGLTAQATDGICLDSCTPLDLRDLLNRLYNPTESNWASDPLSLLGDDEDEVVGGSQGAVPSDVSMTQIPTITPATALINKQGIPVGQKLQVATIENGAGQTHYTSSNAAVATVDSSGIMTAVAPGEATITVNVEDNPPTFTSNRLDIVVTVIKKTPTITATTKTVSMGATVSIGATATSGAGTISYQTNDSAVISVDRTTGKVVPVSAGTATVTVTTAETATFLPASLPVTVTVTKGTAAITAKDMTVQVGTPVSLGATITQGASPMTYKSNDTSVVTVDASGTVTAKKAGHATLTISAAENTNWKGTTKTVTITVPEPPVLASAPVAQGGTQEYMEGQGGTLTITDTVTYRYLDPDTKYLLHEEVQTKDGKAITSTDREFTPDKSDGNISMTMKTGRSDARGELSTKVELHLGNRMVATAKGGQTIKPKTATIDGTLELTTGGKTFAATDAGSVSLTAKVTYKNLIPKQAYEIKGTINGKNNTTDKGPITGIVAKKFTPDRAEGTETLNFSIDISSISSPALYATETLYQEDSVLATHKDPTNGNQTVTPKKPYIDATLKFQDGTKEQNADATGAKLTNSITYNGLTANKDYEAHVTLHAKKGNSDGGIIPGTEVTIPIKAKEGENKLSVSIEGVTVTETTDAVAFTEIREKGKTKVIASNANIADANQTVRINVPALGKVLVTSDGAQSIIAATRATTVTDQITYNDLTPGKTYEIIGTAQAFAADDNTVISEVTVSKSITPTKSNGSETLSYDIALAGQGIGSIRSTAQIREAGSERALASKVDAAKDGITVGKPAIAPVLSSDGVTQDIDLRADVTTLPVTSAIGYKGLVPGQEYLAKSSVHAVKGGQDAGVIAGSEGSTAFTPSAQDGIVEVSMTLATARIESDTISTVDEIWHDGQLILANGAVGADAKVTRIHRPAIQSSLTTADGESVVKDATAETVTLTDTIRYTDLTPGREYEVSSELHMQDENGNDAGAVNGGKTTMKFVPQSSDGEIKVNMTVALKDVMEKTLVAYEEIRSAVSAASSTGTTSARITGTQSSDKDEANGNKDSGDTDSPDGKGDANGESAVLVAQRKVISDPSQAVTVESKATSTQGVMASLAQTGDAVVVGVSTIVALGATAYAIARHNRKNA